MPVRNRKPTTPSSRFTTVRDYSELSDERPEKRLTEARPYHAGRSKGRISVRRKGGQHKRQYRMVDFKRDNHGVPGTVHSIQYDPNRSADLALVVFADGDKRYLLSPRGLRVGATVQSGPGAPIEIGNALPIGDLPLGIAIHNVELTPGRGGQLVRAAGNSATLVAREGKYATVRLPSGETRLVHVRCMASIGEIGNPDHMNVSLGKAGRARWMGRRPKVRGVAMNPVDHPHGGGEGKASGGRHPVSPWGKLTKGMKTRNKRKRSGDFIVGGRR